MKKIITSTKFLVLGLTAIGGIFFTIANGILYLIFRENIPSIYLDVMYLFTLSFLILATYYSISRREIPRIGRTPIKGLLAVVLGVISMILLVIIAGFIVYLLITGYGSRTLASLYDPKAEAHEEMKQGEQKGKVIINALETYKKDNAKYPSTLKELVPGYLEEIPQTDTKQIYQYRLNDLGYFELGFLVVNEKHADCAYSSRFGDWECGFSAEP